ncbi:hypothetical protein [Maridesulfovibrio zosterae]|uniref:hypothetical protein n=1 Tax=Maridesulfovibrio zosterae TaxID=82171 RepID=UPI00040B2C5B|nr:hypothetical protein [Maridesulfovibrio zosterae]
MHKHIVILATLIFLSVPSVQAQAGEIKLGKNLAIEQDSDSKKSSLQNEFDMHAKPYDDVKISDGVSAGIITEQEDFTMENKQRTPARDKGREVGVGLSLSF